MGADMILTGCPAPVDRNEQPITTATPEFIEALYERLRSINTANPKSLPLYVDDAENGWVPSLTDPEVLTSIVDVVAKDIIAVVNEWWEDRRDLTWRTNGDNPRLWIYTGGMTWGDPPTDSYAIIEFIDFLDVFIDPFDIDGGNG